jgi:hypothetical protein
LDLPDMTPMVVVAMVAAAILLDVAAAMVVVDVSVPVGAVVVLQGASKCALTGIVLLSMIKVRT